MKFQSTKKASTGLSQHLPADIRKERQKESLAYLNGERESIWTYIGIGAALLLILILLFVSPH